MRQILQSLKTGKIDLTEVPVPSVKKGHLLIQTDKTLISLGTERMLLNFGKAGWLNKARQQPDKVRQVIQKMRTDGLMPTVDAVFKKLDQPLPLGYSNAGTVIALGEGVTGFKIGDRVISNGNHAEIVCVPQHLCALIPENVDNATASFTVVAAIALQGVRLAAPEIGQKIAVIGLGLIGLLTCQILRANGCRVIGFDFDPAKIELAKSYGAEAFNLSAGSDPVSLAMNFSKGNGVDSVIITAATSGNDPIEQAPQMCRKRGKVVLVGVTGLNLSRDDFYKKEISFQVSCSYGPGRYENEYENKSLDYPIGFVRWTVQRNFAAILDLMSSGSINTDKLVSKTIEFDQAQKAYELVESATGILGLVLNYSGEIDLNQRSVTLKGSKVPPPEAYNSQKAVVGVIGAGNFASGTLIPAFVKAGARLKTIASSGGVSGTVVGRKNGFEISTTDTSRIFSDPDIDTVVITTRHDTHARFIVEALNNNKNVFAEKPLCLNFAELKKITDLWQIKKDKGLRLMVGFNRRFSPLVQTCKNALKSIDCPASFIITVNAGAVPADHWTQDSESGGGRIAGEACHFIDLLRFLAGSEIISVQTAFMNDPQAENRIPDSASITVTFANGSIGTVHYFANGNKDFPKERIEIFANGGILQIDNFKSLTNYGFGNTKNQSLWAQDKGHASCVAEFVDAIKNAKPSPIEPEEIFETAKATLQAAGLNNNEATDA
jgi:predicted dehydrogenase/threonine dehydrogenase-like Zn-dependent dehydrogenase